MRLLKNHEIELIEALLKKDSNLTKLVVPVLNTILIEEAANGGMGGLIFRCQSNDSDRIFGRTVAEAEFLDEDKVLVSVELNLDTNNQLFELDVWKVDFSPLSKWPDISQIVIQ